MKTELVNSIQLNPNKRGNWIDRYRVKMITSSIDIEYKIRLWMEHKSMDDDEIKTILEPLGINPRNEYYDYYVNQAMATFNNSQAIELRNYLRSFPKSRIYKLHTLQPLTSGISEFLYEMYFLEEGVFYEPFYEREDYPLDFEVLGRFDPDTDILSEIHQEYIDFE